MDPEKTSKEHVDEDILQCRAEILRALGQKPAEAESDSGDSAVQEESMENLSDTTSPIEESEGTELPIEGAGSGSPGQSAAEVKFEASQEPVEEQKTAEEKIEKAFEEPEDVDTESSDSFENLLIEEDHAEPETAAEPIRTSPSDTRSVLRDEEKPKIARPSKQEIQQYKRAIKQLKTQKENLSETCRNQEVHISALAEQMAQIQREYRQAEEKITSLNAEISRLAGLQKSQDRNRQQLEKALAESKQQHQALLEEKKQQADSLRQQADKYASLVADHESIKSHLEEQTEKNKSLTEQVVELEQQIEAQKTQLREADSIRRQQENQDREMNSLREKFEESQRTIAHLNHLLEEARREKTSLQKQIRELEQSLLRQQQEAEQDRATLQEALVGVEKQLEDLQHRYDRLSQTSAAVQAHNAPEQEETLDPAFSQNPDFLPSPLESEPEEKTAEPASFPDHKDFVPRFDLSEQILASQRQQSSERRRPPSSGRKIPAGSVHNVVRQFVSPVAEDRRREVSPGPSPQPAAKQFSCEPMTSVEFCHPVIADIVRKDIENYCRNNQWITIDFPSEI